MYASETERKTLHEITSRKSIRITIGIILMLCTVSILCLLLAKDLLYTHTPFLFYSLLLLIVFAGVWRMSILKVIMLEISKYNLMVKYTHPLKQIRYEPPVLEIPLKKLDSFTITREFFVYYLVINRKSEKGNGVKNFYFRLGLLSGKQIKKIREILNTVREETLSP